jgi:hypothetical protein
VRPALILAHTSPDHSDGQCETTLSPSCQGLLGPRGMGNYFDKTGFKWKVELRKNENLTINCFETG